MLILRTKSKMFAVGGEAVYNQAAKPPMPQEQQSQPNPQAPVQNSTELLVEQMKLQRALLSVQKHRQKVQAEENRDRMRSLQNAQRIEQKRDEQENKNMIRRKKLEENEGAKNVSLYKTRSKGTDPVPMKK